MSLIPKTKIAKVTVPVMTEEVFKTLIGENSNCMLQYQKSVETVFEGGIFILPVLNDYNNELFRIKAVESDSNFISWIISPHQQATLKRNYNKLMTNKHFVLPKTYFVGYTSIDINALTDYLEDTDQSEFLEEIDAARKEGLDDGEILCSFYAKSCYASLTNKKNKNISKTRSIYDNILGTIDSGHGCYDKETDVLTRSGWVNWQNINGDEEFATLNKNHVVEYHKAINKNEYVYNGKLISFKNTNVDLLVTPNHNMYVCETTTKNGRLKKDSNYTLVKADTLLHKSHAYIKGCNLSTKFTNFLPIYQLIGFAISDGNIDRHCLSFHLKRERKINYLKNLCSIANITLHINEKNNEYHITLKDLDDNYCNHFKSIYNAEKEKIIPQSILESNDINILKSIFDGMINSDGSIDKNQSIIYDTTSKTLSDQMQILCLHIGMSANISQAESYKTRLTSYGKKHIFRLNIFTKHQKPEINLVKGGTSSITYVDYNDTVYCVEVPNNTLYVRRNGKAIWCGNSVLEHCQLNFMVTNCSRVFTHEQVRHRQSNYSQTSGRYVRSDVLNMIVDPILQPIIDNGHAEKGRKMIEDWYNEAVTMLKLDEVKDFSTKKKVTSALRRFMPNGQSNEIGVSVNLRSLRQIIEMRTSEHAEWEIRLIYNQIYDLVKEKYPAIFTDAIVEYVGGQNQITFKNKKI